VFTVTVTAQPASLAPHRTGPVPGARVVSGEAVELEVRLARVGSRALALMLDILAQATLACILVPLAGLAIAILAGDLADGALFQGGLIVCIATIFVGYPVLLETITGGRTLGKLALGIRVVRDDGGPIRFRHALTRNLVGVALEWPGLLLVPVTWVASLATMLVHPRGKRLGDLAAGTIVIHERSPASWGWVPTMPPGLARWSSTLDLTGLEDDLALAVRHFLARGRLIAEPERSRLGRALAFEVAACTTPGPPPGIPGWAYLAAVLAERHRRAAFRLARARAVTAALWPDLAVSGTMFPAPHNFTGWAPPVPAAPPPAHPGALPPLRPSAPVAPE
jgi:uncharacterized RDD family membrane protein YckC